MPMLPPAPPMFSTTNVVPSVRPMCSPTRRATTSVGPPAANGTMTVIGLLGYCASAGVVSEASATIPPAARKPVRRIMPSLEVRIPIMDAESRPDK